MMILWKSTGAGCFPAAWPASLYKTHFWSSLHIHELDSWKGIWMVHCPKTADTSVVSVCLCVYMDYTIRTHYMVALIRFNDPIFPTISSHAAWKKNCNVIKLLEQMRCFQLIIIMYFILSISILNSISRESFHRLLKQIFLDFSLNSFIQILKSKICHELMQ